MNIITMDNSEYIIWAPKALTGHGLIQKENLLIVINDHKIISMTSIQKDEISADILQHNNFYCLEDDITLLPCLIDAHVHLAIWGNNNNSVWDNDEGLLIRIQEDLHAFMAQGIFSVRDGGDCRGINLKVRNLIKERRISGPLVISTGEALRKEGSYGSFLGNGHSSKKDLAENIDRRLASGINQLKVITSGIVSFRDYGKVNSPVISRDELQYIVSSARAVGVKVMAHASSAEAVHMSIEEGVDSIEHGYFLNKELLKKMAERSITWVPTIIPVVAQVREPVVNDKSQKEIDIITRIYEEQMANLLCARNMGVPLGLGTDSGASGVKHGIGLLEEMLLYSRAGLSNKDVLQSATIVNAKTLGLDENMGCIQNSKKPCLIGVQGDPTIDLNVLKKVKWAFQPQ